MVYSEYLCGQDLGFRMDQQPSRHLRGCSPEADAVSWAHYFAVLKVRQAGRMHLGGFLGANMAYHLLRTVY